MAELPIPQKLWSLGAMLPTMKEEKACGTIDSSQALSTYTRDVGEGLAVLSSARAM